MAWRLLLERWINLGAERLCLEAPSVEAAAAGWIDRAGHIADQNDPLPLLFHDGIGNGDRGHQGLSVGMPGRLKQHIAAGQLHDSTEVHHGHAVGDFAALPSSLSTESVMTVS